MSAKTLVLVAEDDVLLSQFFVDILQIAGYRTKTAATAAEGLRIANTEELGAGLIDLQLGDGMTGVSLVEELRQRAIPTVICSGHGGSYVRKEVARLSTTVLVKPVTMDQLIEAVDSAVKG